MEEYKVNLLNLNQPDFFQDAEKFAFFYSKEFKKFFDNKSMNNADDSKIIEGYLELAANGRKIYRKFHGWHVSSGIVQLTYRTMCELKVKEDDKVIVKKSNWFKYYYFNSDSGTKWGFRIALFSLILGAVAIIKDLICTFLLCNCC